MKPKQIACKNCEEKFSEGFQFCPYCGQKTNEELTLKILFYNTFHNYFSVDARFFKSFIPLMAKPGYIAKRFIEGKRLLYLHPAQMYLFVSVVFFFLFSFISREQAENVDKALRENFKDPATLSVEKVEELNNKIKEAPELKNINIEGLEKLDSIVTNDDKIEIKKNLSFDFDQKKVDYLISKNASDETIYKAMGMPDNAGFFKRKLYAQSLKFYRQRNGGSLLQGFYDSIPIAMFILLPIFALMLKLLFYNKGPFSHHLVFSFYFFTFLFMAFSVLLLANFIINLPAFLLTVIILSTSFYLFLAIKRFYDQGWILSFIKTGVVSFSFLLFVIPFAIIILGVATFMFY